MRDPQDDDLLKRLQAGDERAFADLSDAYRFKIYQLAFRYLRNKEDAEEVAQDVLYKVYRNIASFRGDAALSSWIYRITFNAAMSRLRTARSRKEQDEERHVVSPNGEEPIVAHDVADLSDMADDASSGRSSVGACSAPSSRCPPSTARRSCSAISRGCRPKRRARCSG
jgi:RNA polymerase sigma factor (sigma-70 family)